MKLIVKSLYYLGFIFGVVQTILLAAPIPNLPASKMVIITGVIGILSGLTTTFYQWLNDSIKNSFAISGILIVLTSIGGAINEATQILPLSEQVSSWLTYLVTVISLVVQITSKWISSQTETN